MGSLLFEVRAVDPLTYAAVAITLTLAAVARELVAGAARVGRRPGGSPRGGVDG